MHCFSFDIETIPDVDLGRRLYRLDDLSGFATPIANMPAAVQAVTLLDPLRYFLVVLRKLFLEGVSFDVLLHQLWPMGLIGVVSLAIAGWLFRNRMY